VLTNHPPLWALLERTLTIGTVAGGDATLRRRKIVNQRRDARPRTRRGLGGLSYRYVAGAVITILVVIFIAMNRDRTSISFILFSAETVLWVALTLAAVGGFVAGFLLGRNRYRT
jgi:uncharacterized integral membrane protein